MESLEKSLLLFAQNRVWEKSPTTYFCTKLLFLPGTQSKFCLGYSYFRWLDDLIDEAITEGKVCLDGGDVYTREGKEVIDLRRRVGMVFQKPNPFPKSIFENVAYGLRINGYKKEIVNEMVIRSLKEVALYDEVKDHLHESALKLSGGQQQRLCIARAIAVRPDVLLMDEPASSLDPLSTQKLEDLIDTLKKDYTIVIVTHNMQQAARISDFTAFFYMGSLIEYDRTDVVFTTPTHKKTEDYITGRFG